MRCEPPLCGSAQVTAARQASKIKRYEVFRLFMVFLSSRIFCAGQPDKPDRGKCHNALNSPVPCTNSRQSLPRSLRAGNVIRRKGCLGILRSKNHQPLPNLDRHQQSSDPLCRRTRGGSCGSVQVAWALEVRQPVKTLLTANRLVTNQETGAAAGCTWRSISFAAAGPSPQIATRSFRCSPHPEPCAPGRRVSSMQQRPDSATPPGPSKWTS